MAHEQEADINRNLPGKAVVYKTYDDGYVVRGMTADDAKVVIGWYTHMGKISRYDLNVCLECFPPEKRGFYIGEYEGEVVASAVRLPWSGAGSDVGDVFYGSYYYVAKSCRGKGFGTRLRDQLAVEHWRVGKNVLCVDAVKGKVTENNQKKFEYVHRWETGRWAGVAKETVDGLGECPYSIVSAAEVPIDAILAYDDKCFVRPGYDVRHKFMRRWVQLDGGATYVALDAQGQVKGFGCRRPCLQENNEIVGPLYADDACAAEHILQRLCQDVVGKDVTINIWYTNEESVAMVKKFGFQMVFEVNRMHVNGDAQEFKKTTFALTSIDVCGF